MKLLVTGGTGFLGRRVAAHFVALGWQVMTPSHSELDITDSAVLQAWFLKNRPAAVIHTAAVSDTGLCQRQPEWSGEINVAGCTYLAEACRETGAKLVMCSSDQVYFGGDCLGPHKETEALCPRTVYGSQKLEAERQVLARMPDAACLRLSWMYARDSFPGEHGHFFATLTETLENEALPLSWPVYDRRGLTDVKYVVENLEKALALPGGAWNFGSGNDQSTFDTVKSVLEGLGLEKGLGRLTPNVEAFAANPRDITMDQTKLRQVGIVFPTTAEGLRCCLAEWKQEKK